MQEKKQLMRYTEQELSLIRNTFNNDSLLKAIRKVFLQAPLNAVDLSNLELIKKEEVLKVLRKEFLPTIDPEAPINQVIDLWMTVDIKGKTLDEAYTHFQARDKLVKYLDQQLKELETGKKGLLKFKSLSYAKRKTPEQLYIDLDVRNRLVLHIEDRLRDLTNLSIPEETEEEREKRQKLDSAK
jgi:hypothetical protein